MQYLALCPVMGLPNPKPACDVLQPRNAGHLHVSSDPNHRHRWAVEAVHSALPRRTAAGKFLYGGKGYKAREAMLFRSTAKWCQRESVWYVRK